LARRRLDRRRALAASKTGQLSPARITAAFSSYFQSRSTATEKMTIDIKNIPDKIRNFFNGITVWLKTFAGLALAVLVLSTLASMLGHPIPYVPAFKAGLQEVGIFTAAIAYFLK
jgi:hypothetical protein